ncbi:MAG: hypothetical protein FJW35_09730, partial [Acidobacteria bacterium]|nr:hypothetical protein [Acidobacteriota bacterium]
MKIRTTAIGMLAALALVFYAAGRDPAAARPMQDDVNAKARAIHEKALTLDTHVDIAGAQYATPQLDPGSEDSPLKCDLVKMKKGGLDGVFLAVYVGQRPALDAAGYKAAYENAMTKFEAIHRL